MRGGARVWLKADKDVRQRFYALWTGSDIGVSTFCFTSRADFDFQLSGRFDYGIWWIIEASFSHLALSLPDLSVCHRFSSVPNLTPFADNLHLFIRQGHDSRNKVKVNKLIWDIRAQFDENKADKVRGGEGRGGKKCRQEIGKRSIGWHATRLSKSYVKIRSGSFQFGSKISNLRSAVSARGASRADFYASWRTFFEFSNF